MGKAQSPLLGFNNNVKHRGRVYHIQTEDSGVKYPHVITHLFADGGRILKSIKTSYSEHLGSEGLRETVHELMKEQHKSMLIALREGQIDAIADDTSQPNSVGSPAGSTIGSRSPEVVSAPTSPKVSLPAVANAASSVPHPSPSFNARATLYFGNAPTPAAPPLPRSVVHSSAQSSTKNSVPPRHPTMHQSSPVSSSLSASGQIAKTQMIISLPPDAVESVGQKTGIMAGRYSVARPAAIFASASLNDVSTSIFVQDVMGAKVIDDAILGFLAEECGLSAAESRS